jgi:hypothetical protein
MLMSSDLGGGRVGGWGGSFWGLVEDREFVWGVSLTPFVIYYVVGSMLFGLAAVILTYLEQYALNEAAFVMSRLLQRYDKIKSQDAKKSLKKKLTTLLSPADGVKVRLHSACSPSA